MISEDRFIENLNNFLNIEEIEDDTVNGVQIDADTTINKLAFAVDPSRDIIERALEENCDLLLTHHGLIWGGIKSVTGANYDILSSFIKNDMGLYACHLPLDVHPEIGNNVLLAKMIGAEPVETFMEYKGTEVSLIAELPEPKRVEEISEVMSSRLNNEPFTLKPERQVEKVAIMTGKGGMALSEAYERGVDLFISGEKQYMYFLESMNMDFPIIYGGHYATETLGVKELMEKVEDEYDYDCVWLERHVSI
ncbi:MAG: Nif3-like dinuclear metal center hexameric protein [Thermoplasmatota archaeon]